MLSENTCFNRGAARGFSIMSARLSGIHLCRNGVAGDLVSRSCCLCDDETALALDTMIYTPEQTGLSASDFMRFATEATLKGIELRLQLIPRYIPRPCMCAYHSAPHNTPLMMIRAGGIARICSCYIWCQGLYWPRENPKIPVKSDESLKLTL